MWRRKAGTTLAKAKRNATIFITETDQLIQAAKGASQTQEQKLLSLLPNREEIPDEIDSHDLVQGVSKEPVHLNNKGTVNPEYERLHQLATGVPKGTARQVHSADDLTQTNNPSKGSSTWHCLRVDPLHHQVDGAQRQTTHRASHQGRRTLMAC